LQFWADSELISEAARERVQALTQNPEKEAVRGWMAEYERGEYHDLVADYLAPDDIRMVVVEGGAFTRGDKKVTQEVTLDSFRIANIPVTFRQYGLYLYAAGEEKKRLADMKLSWGIQADHPVVKVNWYDAVEYCNWLSVAMGLAPVYEIDKTKKDPNNNNEDDKLKWLVTLNDTANGFRLPTEAEWEYAARGGRKSKGFEYAGSNDLEEAGWHINNSNRQTHAAAQKLPNELGLYDMSGNVWEWCWDWKDIYTSPLERNPRGPDSGYCRVLRGGSWYDYPRSCRAAYRNNDRPTIRYRYIGFRLARSF